MKKIFIIIGIILTSISIYNFCNNDYMEFKERKCIVLDKMVVDGGKYSDNFYLVLKEERGIIFDQMVSPSTYSQADSGEIVYFNLRQFDIRQTTKENWKDFFGVVILFAFGIVLTLASIFFPYNIE
jgi:hypothetical protein